MLQDTQGLDDLAFLHTRYMGTKRPREEVLKGLIFVIKQSAGHVWSFFSDECSWDTKTLTVIDWFRQNSENTLEMNVGCSLITTLSLWKNICCSPAMRACSSDSPWWLWQRLVMVRWYNKHYSNCLNGGSISCRRTTLSFHVGAWSLTRGQVWRRPLQNLYHGMWKDWMWLYGCMACWYCCQMDFSSLGLLASAAVCNLESLVLGCPLVHTEFTLTCLHGKSFLLQGVRLPSGGFEYVKQSLGPAGSNLCSVQLANIQTTRSNNRVWKQYLTMVLRQRVWTDAKAYGEMAGPL